MHAAEIEDAAQDLIELSAEAALELAEMRKGVRPDAPAFGKLSNALRKPAKAYRGNAVSMLADVRSWPMLRGAVEGQVTIKQPQELVSAVERLLTQLETAINDKDYKLIDGAKTFCLALNRGLVTREMAEIHSRRERSDSRYIVL